VLALEIGLDAWALHVATAEVRPKRPDDFVLHLLGPVPIGDTRGNTRKLFGNLCGIARWGQLGPVGLSGVVGAMCFWRLMRKMDEYNALL
jgi:hypothetical protein